MAIFSITFELRNQSKNHDYNRLLQALQEQKCHPLMQNQWLGSFNNNATQVHAFFKGLLDKTDRLMVAELAQHYAYSNAMRNCNEWLKLNPPAIYKGPDDLGAPGKKAAPAKPPAKVPAENPDKPAAASKKKAKA